MKLVPGAPVGPAQADRICPRYRCWVRDGEVLIDPDELAAKYPDLRESLRA